MFSACSVILWLIICPVTYIIESEDSHCMNATAPCMSCTCTSLRLATPSNVVHSTSRSYGYAFLHEGEVCTLVLFHSSKALLIVLPATLSSEQEHAISSSCRDSKQDTIYMTWNMQTIFGLANCCCKLVRNP